MLIDQLLFYVASPQMTVSEIVKEKNGIVGIGLNVNCATDICHTFVLSLAKGYTAEEAGILEHDEIISVEGKSVSKMNLEQFMQSCRGKPDTTATFEIKRDDKILTFALTRKEEIVSN